LLYQYGINIEDHYASQIIDSKMVNHKDCGSLEYEFVCSGRKVAASRKKMLCSSAGMTEAEGPFVNWYMAIILVGITS